jgi:hypothetical protein
MICVGGCSASGLADSTAQVLTASKFFPTQGISSRRRALILDLSENSGAVIHHLVGSAQPPVPPLLDSDATQEGTDSTKEGADSRQLGVNHQPFWAKATEGAAPAWVRRVEPHNNAAGHRYNANDLAAGLWLSTNANAAPNKEHIERRVVVLI